MHLLPLLFLLTVSCSDNLLYNEAKPRIFINVINRSDTVKVGESVHFKAIINPSPEDAVNFFWVIEAKNSPYGLYTKLEFDRVFNDSGLYNVRFYAADAFGDEQETSFFIRASKAPVCKYLSLDFFQGSPIFEWNCYDTGGNDLTYNFLLLNASNRILLDTILTENSLQLGYYLLPENYVTRLIAENSYGIKTQLDSTWSSP